MPGDTLTPEPETLDLPDGYWAEVQEPLENQEPTCPDWALPNSPLIEVGKWFNGAPIDEARAARLRLEAATLHRIYEQRHARWMQRMYPALANGQTAAFREVKAEVQARPAPPEPAPPAEAPAFTPSTDSPGAAARATLAEQRERFARQEEERTTVVNQASEEEQAAARRRLQAIQAQVNERYPRQRTSDEPPHEEGDGWTEVVRDWPTPPDPRDHTK